MKVAVAARLLADAVPAVARSGMLAPVRPDRLFAMAGAGVRMGPTVATVAAVAAARHPARAAIIDERGTLTYAQLAERVEAIAAGLARGHGIGPQSTVGLLCRNHAGFVEGLLATARLGANLVLLNTEFSAPQLRDVLAREGVDAVIHDDEHSAVMIASEFAGARMVAWQDGPGDRVTLDTLARSSAPRPPRAPQAGRTVLLTSGTTGTPKGAGRAPSPLAFAGPAITMLRALPVKAGDRIWVGPPLFHGLGIAFFGLGLALGMTMVLQRRFKPGEALAAWAQHDVTTIAAVPVMLQRVLALDAEERAGRDTSSLRAVISGGSALSADLATGFMDAFGDIVFDLYGSTETGWCAMATPADLRAAPGTVGRPPHGMELRILDGGGKVLPTGATGRIFARSEMSFEGYTGGGGKEVVDGFMSTGDMGHLDAEGRLFVSGRDDDMIVSGGENVFPQEVQETLAGHAAVADVAVIGVDDADFGQRLSAFVVLADGADVTGDDLRDHVKSQLARFKVPRDIEFVDEIPRNATGKILARVLREAS